MASHSCLLCLKSETSHVAIRATKGFVCEKCLLNALLLQNLWFALNGVQPQMWHFKAFSPCCKSHVTRTQLSPALCFTSWHRFDRHSQGFACPLTPRGTFFGRGPNLEKTRLWAVMGERWHVGDNTGTSACHCFMVGMARAKKKEKNRIKKKKPKRMESTKHIFCWANAKHFSEGEW